MQEYKLSRSTRTRAPRKRRLRFKRYDTHILPEHRTFARLTWKQALPQGFHSNRVKGVAIATDIDDGSQPTLDLPEPSKAGAIDTKKEAEKAGESGFAAADEDTGMGRDTTGWEPRFGWPAEPIEEGESMQDHTTWLESNLADHLYGGKSCTHPP